MNPDITFWTIEGKCIVQIEIYPGQNRPYYIRSFGKENGTYIRIAGTSRPVDEAVLKNLEYQGAGKSFDELINVGTDYDEESALQLWGDIGRCIAESRENTIISERQLEGGFHSGLPVIFRKTPCFFRKTFSKPV